MSVSCTGCWTARSPSTCTSDCSCAPPVLSTDRSKSREAAGPGEAKSNPCWEVPFSASSVPVEAKDSSLVVLSWVKLPASSINPLPTAAMPSLAVTGLGVVRLPPPCATWKMTETPGTGLPMAAVTRTDGTIGTGLPTDAIWLMPSTAVSDATIPAVDVAVKVTVPTEVVAVTCCVPTPGPSVKSTCACPAASVSSLLLDMLPPPATTAKSTDTSSTPRPSVAVTSTTSGSGSCWPAGPV